MRVIEIPNEIFEEIKLHAEKTYPEECCGILIGKLDGLQKFVFEILKVENSKENERERRYLIKPQDYINAEKYARTKGYDIIGFYHSHPETFHLYILPLNLGKPLRLSLSQSSAPILNTLP